MEELPCAPPSSLPPFFPSLVFVEVVVAAAVAVAVAEATAFLFSVEGTLGFR